MRGKILVVDDEKDIVDLIAYNLEKEGFSVTEAFDGEQAQQYIKNGRFDLVILDLMLPGVAGMDVCKWIRKRPDTERLPIIMLTARGEALDKILGLEMGADDYVTKPFHVRELIARIRAVLRRSEKPQKEQMKATFSFGGLHIDYDSYEVTVEGRRLALSPTEMKLLCFLTAHPGRVYSRDQLLDHLWKDEAFVEPRTVDVHISRLRAAIETDKENPKYILTVRGIGYKFADPAQQGAISSEAG
ncbi:MAG: response regulator transcription factor [Deltaproteobacteria bacterium]|nr:response regulator transcription factor [Deltaproteobacteria bacterium]